MHKPFILKCLHTKYCPLQKARGDHIYSCVEFAAALFVSPSFVSIIRLREPEEDACAAVKAVVFRSPTASLVGVVARSSGSSPGAVSFPPAPSESAVICARHAGWEVANRHDMIKHPRVIVISTTTNRCWHTLVLQGQSTENGE